MPNFSNIRKVIVYAREILATHGESYPRVEALIQQAEMDVSHYEHEVLEWHPWPEKPEQGKSVLFVWQTGDYTVTQKYNSLVSYDLGSIKVEKWAYLPDQEGEKL
jgi:hypothetical protein